MNNKQKITIIFVVLIGLCILASISGCATSKPLCLNYAKIITYNNNMPYTQVICTQR